MNDQHQRRALSAIAAGLVMLLAGCANAAAAEAPPAVASATISTTTATASPTRGAPTQASAKPSLGGDNQPGCAARAMARWTFNPACIEYQGYLDPGTAGGRAPTSGEIQRVKLCRSGEIPKVVC